MGVGGSGVLANHLVTQLRVTKQGQIPDARAILALGDFCKPWIDHFAQIELEPHISPGLAPDKRIHNFPLKPVCNIRAPLLLKVG